VPVTVKVNIDQEGFATTSGEAAARHHRQSNSPVVDNLRKSGAVILRRTNCPASYRWFTTDLVHGDTRSATGITPGGSPAGGARSRRHRPHCPRHRRADLSALAYACGARPAADHSRITAFNAALLTADRAADQRRLAVGADHRRYQDRAGRDVGGTTAILVGAGAARRPAMPARRDVSQPMASIPFPLKAAVADAGKRLSARLDRQEIANTPSLREAADLQTKLWLGDGYEAQLDAAEREAIGALVACAATGQKCSVRPVGR
jgi:amidase